MKLSKEDVELFYRLYHPLLAYVNKKFEIIEDVDSSGDFKKFSIEEINKLRDRLYKHPELINSFVAENPLSFSENELKIINSWKEFVKGKFLIFRYLKNYTVFLDTNESPKAYGVLALNSTFEEMVGPYLPVMVEAVLLPFNDKIIYDSIFFPYHMTFGGGIRRSFNDAYQEAKSRFGIITSLPFLIEKVEQMYWEEIEELISKNTNLLTLYHQEMGKIHARTYGKRLHEIGLTNAWFAILEGMTIASGATKDEVERILQCILPTEKRKFVYIFRLKEK